MMPKVGPFTPGHAPLLIAVSVLAVLLVAGCGVAEEPRQSPGRTSPPVPAGAPASVVQSAAQALGSGGAEESVGGPTLEHQAGGTEQEVGLRDPEGSGEYGFDPAELTFKVGETVNFTLTSELEFHTFTVDALGIDQAADVGSTVTFSFTFETAGTFPLKCVPHEALGMVGAITVK